MHPLTYEVMKSIPLLELEQFRHIEDRERLNEIRALAGDWKALGSPTAQIAYSTKHGIVNSQVDDDAADSRQETYWKEGRTRMVHRPGTLEGTDQEEGMWERRTPRALALEAGLTPLLDSILTAEQRVKVRLRYEGSGESFKQIGDRYGTTKQAVEQQFKTIHKKLREALLLAYGPPPPQEVEDEQG